MLLNNNGNNGKTDFRWLSSYESIDFSILDGAYSGHELKDITRIILKSIGRPMDAYAVTSTLESLGWRDIDAQENFNKKNLFELGAAVYSKCIEQPVKNNAVMRSLEKEEPLKSFIIRFSQGSLYILPIIGQILALFFLRFSLWASLDFTESQATTVATGTIFSFIITGGFMQSIGRDTIHYLSLKNLLLVKKSYYKQLWTGIKTVCLFAISFVLINFFLPFFNFQMAFVIAIYFVLLSLLWLSLSILYVIKHYAAILIITLIAIGPVYLFMHYTQWGIYTAHFAGLLTANLLSLIYGYEWLQRKTRGLESSIKLPKRSIMAYVLSPYFLIGFLYFTFLFTDRIIAWSTFSRDPSPYLIWFKTPYELGMDWALVSLLFTVAILEYIIEKFSKLLIPKQVQTFAQDSARFNKTFIRFYKKHLVLFALTGSLSILISYFAISRLQVFGHLEIVQDFFSNHITFFVFYLAAIAYFFLALGLLNCLAFFTLSRPFFAIKAISVSIVVDLAIGIFSSRQFGYEYAVVGLLAGAIVFAFISTIYARKFFSNLDYYYYSAY
ncbi:MAG: hypothetical protein GXO75_04020 [Calditrichaeota bacterium]|nr:hypothetical protein [Calditrichota bacterium]